MNSKNDTGDGIPDLSHLKYCSECDWPAVLGENGTRVGEKILCDDCRDEDT